MPTLLTTRINFLMEKISCYYEICAQNLFHRFLLKKRLKHEDSIKAP